MDKARRLSSHVAAQWPHRVAVPLLGFALISPLVPSPAFAQPYADAAGGGRLAAMWCASCHQVGPLPGDLASDAVPSFRAVANRASTTALSIRVFLHTPHPAMPDLMLTEEQIDTTGSYILGLRDPAPK